MWPAVIELLTIFIVLATIVRYAAKSADEYRFRIATSVTSRGKANAGTPNDRLREIAASGVDQLAIVPCEADQVDPAIKNAAATGKPMEKINHPETTGAAFSGRSS